MKLVLQEILSLSWASRDIIIYYPSLKTSYVYIFYHELFLVIKYFLNFVSKNTRLTVRKQVALSRFNINQWNLNLKSVEINSICEIKCFKNYLQTFSKDRLFAFRLTSSGRNLLGQSNLGITRNLRSDTNVIWNPTAYVIFEFSLNVFYWIRWIQWPKYLSLQ